MVAYSLLFPVPLSSTGRHLLPSSQAFPGSTTFVKSHHCRRRSLCYRVGRPFCATTKSKLPLGRFSPLLQNEIFREKSKLRFHSNSGKFNPPVYLDRSPCKHALRVSMGASFGNMADDSNAFFPRMNIKDPYKRLGISREASEEEIQAARNFLVNKYAGHQPSVDAIESAHDKIIMQKFNERRNPKININKKLREVSQSPIAKAITARFETPSNIHILKTTVAFVLLGALSVVFPTEEGPTLQVAISLIASIYFIYERQKSHLKALLYGSGSFAVSWLLGTFLMVSVVPPILQGPRSLEVTTSLISYIFLWVSSTYLK